VPLLGIFSCFIGRFNRKAKAGELTKASTGRPFKAPVIPFEEIESITKENSAIRSYCDASTQTASDPIEDTRIEKIALNESILVTDVVRVQTKVMNQTTHTQ